MKKLLAPISILIAGVLWGFMSLFTRTLSSLGIPAMSISCIRMIVSAVLLWAFLLIFKRDALKIKLKHLPFLALIGILTMFLMSVCYITAIEMTSASVAAILLYTSPVFIFIFSLIFFKEKITPVKALALFGTLIGSALVVRAYEPSSLGSNIPNILIGLLAGICYSMVTILGKIAKTKCKPEANSGLMLIFGSLVFLFVRPPHTIVLPDMWVLAVYVWLAVMGSVVPYWLYLKGLGTGIDGSYASVAATIEPVVATVLGAACFREGIEVLQIVGIVIVLLSVFAAVTDKS